MEPGGQRMVPDGAQKGLIGGDGCGACHKLAAAAVRRRVLSPQMQADAGRGMLGTYRRVSAGGRPTRVICGTYRAIAEGCCGVGPAVACSRAWQLTGH